VKGRGRRSTGVFNVYHWNATDPHGPHNHLPSNGFLSFQDTLGRIPHPDTAQLPFGDSGIFKGISNRFSDQRF
jgi:hypothetical protein